MLAVTLWEMFTYCEEPWFGLTGRQVPACGAHAKRRTCVHMWNASPPLFVDFSFAIMLRDSEFLTSPTLTVSDPDFVARGAGGRASGETAGLPAGTVHGHEEVLGLQSLRQAQLRPAHHDGCRGVKRCLKLSIEFFSGKNRLIILLTSVRSLQAKPMEVQATRDFAEPRKLALAASDLVTVVDHGWVRGRKEGGTERVKETL